jgi:hypothetical protein
MLQICKANGGVYQESAQEITCRENDSESDGGCVFKKHSNLPDILARIMKKPTISKPLGQCCH